MLKRIEVYTDEYKGYYCPGSYYTKPGWYSHRLTKEIVINTNRIVDIDVDKDTIELDNGNKYEVYGGIDSDLLDELGIK